LFGSSFEPFLWITVTLDIRHTVGTQLVIIDKFVKKNRKGIRENLNVLISFIGMLSLPEE
jgi:hypothetical protein